MPLTIYCDQQSWTVDDLDEADAQLDALQEGSERPKSVTIELGTGATVDVVLGADWSWIQFMPNPPDPPYWVSVGDEESEESRVFFADGHWSETLARNTLQPDLAREITRKLIASGGLVDEIGWEQG